MNSLNREIVPGEIVVMGKQYVKPEYQSLLHRLFLVEGGGFGLHTYTSGRMIYGKYLYDGEKCSVYADRLDAKETKAFQAGELDVKPSDFESQV